MLARRFRRLRRVPPALVILFLVLVAAGLTSCATSRVGFPYPAERAGMVFADSGRTPRVWLGAIEDKRPALQREGQGHFFGITYPADAAWERPVDQTYRAALAQDLAQTRVVTLTNRPEQAAFTLSAEIFSFSCRFDRAAASLAVPFGVGMMGGMVLGANPTNRVRTGALLGVALMMAMPMPAQNRAECEVRLTLTDGGGGVVWQQTCLGEFSGRVFSPVTARNDRGLAQKNLPRAVKRCNACLLGQLRQFLAGAAAPAPGR